MTTHRICIPRPPVIHLRIQSQKTAPHDVLRELSNRIEAVRRRMSDSLTKNEFVSQLDCQSVMFIIFATYMVLPTAKTYIDVTIFLMSWCAGFKFPFLSMALIEAVLLITVFLYIKTWFVISATCVATFKLVSWMITGSQPTWTLNMVRLLTTTENHLETKCNSWGLYSLHQLNRILGPVEIDPAKDHTAIADQVDATRKSKCRVPIGGLDQEGWLFVSHPIVDCKEGSTDPSFS